MNFQCSVCSDYYSHFLNEETVEDSWRNDPANKWPWWPSKGLSQSQTSAAGFKTSLFQHSVASTAYLTSLCLGFLTSGNHRIKVLGASLVAQMVKNLPSMQETWVQSLGQEDPLEKEMVHHSSILAWRIPWTEEPGGLQLRGAQRVGHVMIKRNMMWKVLEMVPGM